MQVPRRWASRVSQVATCATDRAGGADRREWSPREPCSSAEGGGGACPILANPTARFRGTRPVARRSHSSRAIVAIYREPTSASATYHAPVSGGCHGVRTIGFDDDGAPCSWRKPGKLRPPYDVAVFPESEIACVSRGSGGKCLLRCPSLVSAVRELVLPVMRPPPQGRVAACPFPSAPGGPARAHDHSYDR